MAAASHLANQRQRVVQGTEAFKQLQPDELEVVVDRFERSEHRRGEVLTKQGQPCDQIAILRMGELATSGNPSKPLPEIGGFAYFGEDSLRVRLYTNKSRSAAYILLSIRCVIVLVLQSLFSEFESTRHSTKPKNPKPIQPTACNNQGIERVTRLAQSKPLARIPQPGAKKQSLFLVAYADGGRQS